MTKGPLIWSGLSSAVTGISNTAPLLVLQYRVDSVSVGAFALAMSPIVVALGIQRTITAQTLLLGRHPRQTPRLISWLTAVCLSASVIQIAIICLTESKVALWPLLLLLPIALAQDAYRHYCFGQFAPARALLSDVAWLLILIPPCVAVVLIKDLTATWVPLGQLLAAATSLLVAYIARPEARRATAGGRIGVRTLSIEAGIIIGLGQLGTFAAAVVVSVAEVGRAALAGALMTPASLIVSVFTAYAIPRLRFDSRQTLLLAGAIGTTVLTTAGALVFALSAQSSLNLDLFPSDDRFVLTASLAGLALAVSGAATPLATHARHSTTPRRWLLVRGGGALLDPAVGVPLAATFGAPGILCGPIAANTAVAIWTSATVSRSGTHEAKEVRP